MSIILPEVGSGGAIKVHTTAERVLATVALALLVVKVPGFTLFPLPGTIIGLALALVVLPSLRQIPAALSVLWSTIFAVVVGLMLSWTVAATHGTAGNGFDIASAVGWLISIPILLAMGIWGMSVLGALIGFRLIAVGGLASSLLLNDELAWKGSIGFYSTFLALTLLAGESGKRLALTRLALLAAVGLGASNDARSMAAIAGTALIVSFLAAPFSDSILKYRKSWGLALIALLIGTSVLALGAMSSGLLGSAIQMRTLDQTAGGRSILESGRAEWAATLFLAREVPGGFGAGTHVDPGLANAALSAVRSAGGDANSSYFRVLVFGDRTDLHSITADLWAHFGVGGLLVAVVIALCLLSSLPLAAAKTSVGVFALFGTLTASWDLLFSPMGNSDRVVVGLLCAVILSASFGVPRALSTASKKSASFGVSPPSGMKSAAVPAVHGFKPDAVDSEPRGLDAPNSVESHRP